MRVLMSGDRPAVVADRFIDDMRAAENAERPLKMTVEMVIKKKRKRQSRITEVDVTDNAIVGVHSYSPFMEAMRAGEDAVRISAFRKAMGFEV
jgi:hypothetical protein